MEKPGAKTAEKTPLGRHTRCEEMVVLQQFRQHSFTRLQSCQNPAACGGFGVRQPESGEPIVDFRLVLSRRRRANKSWLREGRGAHESWLCERRGARQDRDGPLWP